MTKNVMRCCLQNWHMPAHILDLSLNCHRLNSIVTSDKIGKLTRQIFMIPSNTEKRFVLSVYILSPDQPVLLLYSRLALGLVARTVKKNRQLGLTVLKQGTVHLQTKSVVV